MANLTITPGRQTETRCTFTADQVIYEGEPAHFRRGDEPHPVPLAEAILSVPGVEELELSSRAFTVYKDEGRTWPDLEAPLRYAVTSVLQQAEGASTPSIGQGAGDAPDDDALFEMVAAIFERDINPSVANHGGRVDLIDVQDQTVILRMQGGCQGCGMASVTLRQGIEGTLKRTVPGLRGIHDITDHAAGTDPYFARP